jgi:hypothetical protein
MDFGLKSYQTGCRYCVENTVQLSVFFFATFWILLLQKTRLEHSPNDGCSNWNTVSAKENLPPMLQRSGLDGRFFFARMNRRTFECSF